MIGQSRERRAGIGQPQMGWAGLGGCGAEGDRPLVMSEMCRGDAVSDKVCSDLGDQQVL